MSARGALAALVELIYPMPMRCLACGQAEPAEDGVLCAACLSRLFASAPEHMYSNGAFSIAIAAHPYPGPAGALVRALKYRGISALAAQMGGEIYAALRMTGVAPPERIAFVPMHRARRMRKMFNQSELLARAVAENMGMRSEKLLTRVRRCRQQAGLSSFEARAKNVRGAFRAAEPLHGASVLLVDDVYTTGATARACAKALLEAGARDVVVAVYARGGA